MLRHLILWPLALGLTACGELAKPTAPPSASSAFVDDGVHRVSAAQLLRAQSQGDKVVVVDLREPAAFRKGHIPGAVNLSPEALAQGMFSLPKGSAVVLYCDCLAEMAAAEGALALKRLGHSKVHALEHGLDGWLEQKGPLEQGATAPRPPEVPLL